MEDKNCSTFPILSGIVTLLVILTFGALSPPAHFHRAAFLTLSD